MFSIASYGIEVMLRHSFGERYFSIPVYLITILAVLFWNSFFNFGNIIYNGFSYALDEVGIAYAAILVILGIIHISVIYERNAQGERWHSLSGGISHLTKLWPNDRMVKLLLEPLVVIGIGAIFIFIRTTDSSGYYDELSYPLRAFGLYLIVAAISLFIKEYIINYEMRMQYLNASDQQIEADVMKELMDEGWNEYHKRNWKPLPKDTQGFSVNVPFRPKNKKQYDNFTEMIGNLDPSLQDFLDKRKKGGEGKNPEDDQGGEDDKT